MTRDGPDDHATTLSFCFAEPRASAVAAAVGVEVGEIDDERSGATVSRESAPIDDWEGDRDATTDAVNDRDATTDAVNDRDATTDAVNDRDASTDDPEAVVVRIGAGDLIALRASANTWTRLVGTAAEVAETAEAYVPDAAGG